MTSQVEDVVESTFAVCDAKTGDVYHIHSVAAFDGAKLANDSDAAAEALEFASATGDLRGQLRVVKCPPQYLKRNVHLKLNVKLGKLETVEPRSLRRPRKRLARKRSAKRRRAK